MEQGFQAAYKQLNPEQKQAVDIIDGPLLVVAGPGTGKTQLLSLRVANIIKQTDTSPGNILCLTFTDNAARNMRERLQGIIGQPAYHVAIHTFHSFGNEAINQFPDYFVSSSLLQQIDELGQYELLREIFAELPHSNPLSVKVGDEFIYLKDSLNIISWLKQNALLPHELHEIIAANQQFLQEVNDDLAEAFADTPAPKYVGDYQKLLAKIKRYLTGQRYYGFPEYAAELVAELETAINATPTNGRYAPQITAWRNVWCRKDSDGRQVFKDSGQSLRKMHALANVYQTLRERMAERGLYDYDDMIIEVVQALEHHDDLRFSLQERYQYVLVDEFQDTNKAQLRLLENLGNTPVHEGRPNIMAVGDDDQAIYAFQGAEVSNMLAFTKLYNHTEIITLQQNYRSTPQILAAGYAVAEQINDRLGSIMPAARKHLQAQKNPKNGLLKSTVFPSELAQYDWLAEQIDQLIKSGTKPEDIAVIAPRHKYLERLMPYLGHRRLPVAYERRENILDSPIIVQLLTMARLITAIAANRHNDVDALISQVLAYDFWQLPTEELLKINLTCYNQNKHWLEVLANYPDKQISTITTWFLDLAKHSSQEPLEYVLDQLLGDTSDGVDNEYDTLLLPQAKTNSFNSPMRDFYFSHARYEQATDSYLTLLGQLSTLRQRLRQWKPQQALYIVDFVEFADLHQQAKLRIIDTSPHTQTTNAVQVMTAYKAKGLEFGTVFVINTQDEVWGPTAKSRSPNITLPRNLPIAPASDGDNDKLRLLFVALTRAKHSLYLTGYTHTLDNKPSPSLSFLGNEDLPAHPDFKPELIDKPLPTDVVRILSTDWAYRFRQIMADKPALFKPIIDTYKLSVTHLNNFIDVKDGGPEYFLMHNLLRFPAAPTPSAAYGSAIHQTLQYAHGELRQNDRLPSTVKLQVFFSDLLARKHLRLSDQAKLQKRGQEAIERYFKQRRILAADLIERGFNNEGVVVNGAHLSGKIDKLHLPKPGQAVVVDFKTGKPAKSWQGKDEFEKIKLHKYRQQLLFYKLLVENSASFRHKLSVNSGGLEFIEPDSNDQLIANLELIYQPPELERFIKLITAIWEHITSLNFPDIRQYAPTLKGIERFEQDLIDGKI